jgi:hypothetical protein
MGGFWNHNFIIIIIIIIIIITIFSLGLDYVFGKILSLSYVFFYVKILSNLTSNFRIIVILFVVDSETPVDGECISVYNIKYSYLY